MARSEEERTRNEGQLKNSELKDLQGRTIKNSSAKSAARILQVEKKKEANAHLRARQLTPMQMRRMMLTKKLMPSYRTVVEQGERDMFDITPAHYAREMEICERTARMIFNDWFVEQHEFIRRTGRPTPNYPHGKLLRMSRKYFERVVKG